MFKANTTEYLRDVQYRDSSNLGARANLHERFSTNPIDWKTWVFDQLELAPGSHVLECGCGPGWLWRANVQRLPPDCAITLTDISPGMVAEAGQVLEVSGHDFRFQEADIQALPFEDDRFDIVIANHMLYHVPDLERALAEVTRVLSPHGRFYAATNGLGHLRPLWDLARILMRALEHEKLIDAFKLENGRQKLEPWFGEVRLLIYEDSLRITEVEPVVDYILSMIGLAETGPGEATIERVRNILRQEIAAHRAFEVPKETGLFIASEPVQARQ